MPIDAFREEMKGGLLLIRVKKKNYQNLLIVLLFVVLIFLLGRIFVRTNIFETQESNNTIVLDDLSFKFFIDDVLFPIETKNNIMEGLISFWLIIICFWKLVLTQIQLKKLEELRTILLML